ncbi:MAG TPA: hypothetical protein VMS98_09765 [Thermoanaerobaculia bacterium]|nr:hypothetical protein [Thermoanaerobaculia bacterium]
MRVRSYASKTGRDAAYVYLIVTRGSRAAQPLIARQRQPVTGRQWREYVVESEIPQDAVDLEYGLALAGTGEAFIDSVTVETMAAAASAP